MNLTPIYRRLKFNQLAPPAPERHRRRIARMCEAIQAHFPDVTRPEQIRQKHISWLLQVWFGQQNYKPPTQGDYRSSLRLLIQALGRSNEWFQQLGLGPAGPGGRPPKTAVVRSKSKRYS